jgi:uncharacterized protein YjiS (DUF1127 family)
MELIISSSIAFRRSLPSGLVELIRKTAGISLTIFTMVSAWSERVRQRRQLLSLPDHMLKDIGVSRFDVLKECEKPFWRT